MKVASGSLELFSINGTILKGYVDGFMRSEKMIFVGTGNRLFEL